MHCAYHKLGVHLEAGVAVAAAGQVEKLLAFLVGIQAAFVELVHVQVFGLDFLKLDAIEQAKLCGSVPSCCTRVDAQRTRMVRGSVGHTNCLLALSNTCTRMGAPQRASMQSPLTRYLSLKPESLVQNLRWQ